MIDLLINNLPVDLPDDSISILFQRQRTDYTNPTIVRNSFTKTIKLPGTKTNDTVFDDLWKLDRATDGSMYFNPSKRNPFILLKEGNLVEQGYVKLNNITWDGNFRYYEITLYGELGNLLYGLSYSVNDETDEVTPLTLADLTYDFNGFTINKELIGYAWSRLNGEPETEGDEYKIFDTINFMVSYDGAPQANNFDPKKVWCSVERNAAVWWKDEYYNANSFPATKTETNDGVTVTYSYVSTMLTYMDPDDRYGLLEVKKDMSPLEARDFRSYLLRPVLNVKKMFEAIGGYINENYGYILDMTDPFFSTYEFSSTWMTLSMMYEIDPDVETGTKFTKSQLLKNTSSPASYLISYCKTYGIYLDVDFLDKKLVLTRLPNFFDADKVNDLAVDLSKNVKINPLSFDKASYTFDYGDGDSEFLKKYKESYGLKYGSKKVNTGYRFDASTSPYIDNNVFRQGLDSIDQSVYYRYPNADRNGIYFSYPGALMDEANPPTYKLFDMDTYHQLGEIKTIDGEMSPHWYPTYNNASYNMMNCGYQYMRNWWIGLRPNVWQDGFPKLQCHSNDNKAADGKDILVRFSGFRSVSYGTSYTTQDRTYFVTDSYSDSTLNATKVNYLLSDDHPYLKGFINKNCYYDNQTPAESYGGYTYIKVINSIPAFSRSTYIYDRDYSNIPAMYVSSFGDYTISGQGSVVVLSYPAYFVTSINTGSGRQYPYFTSYGLDANHRYFLASAVKTSNASVISSGNVYACPDIIGSTIIDKREITNSNTVQMLASIVETGSTVPNQITPLSTYDLSNAVVFETYYLIAYDLTEMNLEDKITTVDAAIEYFGVTEKRVGYTYNLTGTLDFGIPRELYVPSCTYEPNIGIYNEYWSNYIADVYSINTRVMECYCKLDNIDKVFREFYYYDNCLWILSKVSEWNMETKMCKATFIKVNDIDNYTN